jgi:hypothetical protein
MVSPQERFYNLVCLAFGADRVGFADLCELFANAGARLPVRIPDIGQGL